MARLAVLGPARGAVSFLTVVPVGGSASAGAVGWFPLVGAGVGAGLGAAWLGADQIWSAFVGAAVVVTLDLAITGFLHVDGLADSADGLLPHAPRDRRLAIMRAPDIGAFGIAVVVAVLLLRVGALASIAPAVALLAAVWCASRTSMAIISRALPYAREQGLPTLFAGGPPWVAWYGVPLALGLGALAGWRGLAAVAVCLGGAGAVALVARRRVGGFTGDVLGAAGVVGETLGLLVAATQW